MNEFKSLEAADSLIAHLTNEPPEPGRARSLTADGTLKVCFAYRGNIGLFARIKTPFGLIIPQPVETFYFVGDLQSVAPPQLDSKVESIAQVPNTKMYQTTISKVDSLHPFEVIPIRKSHAVPDIDMSKLSREGFFWGRVKSEIKRNHEVIRPVMLDQGPVTVDQWRIQSDELRAVFSISSKSKSSIEHPDPERLPISTLEPVGAPAAASWELVVPQRLPGCRYQLLKHLKGVKARGEPCPTAREILDVWRVNPPHGVVEVMSDELKYEDSLGTTQTWNLRAIQKAIKNLLVKPPEGD